MPENEVFSMASYTPTPSASKPATKNGRTKKTAAKAGAKNGKNQSTAPVATAAAAARRSSGNPTT